MAPEQVNLPSGRRLRLRYRNGQPPRGNVRLQDLYGMRETPVVANGRAKVLLEILAPNMRPVQITNDLAGFWEKHYPAVKKSLAKRYPKHEWR
jgi:ATP-dependent helicase HrpB